MVKVNAPTNKKRIGLVLLSDIVIVAETALRFIPIDTKQIYCSSGEFRVIKGELDEYNSVKPPPQEMLILMGRCAEPSSVKLYLI